MRSSAAASGRLGVSSVANGNSRRRRTSTAEGSRSFACTLGHHDRIEHDQDIRMKLEHVGDRIFCDFGTGDHADLDRIDADVANTAWI